MQELRMLQIGLKLAKITLLAIYGVDQTKRDPEMAPHMPEMLPEMRVRALEPSEVVTRRNPTVLRSHEHPVRDVAQKATTAEPVMLVMM